MKNSLGWDYIKMLFSGKKFFSFVLSLILIFSVILYFSPQVKSLDDTHTYFGYVYYENDTAVPVGTTVTLTDQNNSNYMTATTSLSSGYYQADVQQISGSEDGDIIVVNCTLDGESGSNSSAINISGSAQQVDVHMAAPADLSITVTPSSWSQGGIWVGSSNETSGSYFNLSNSGNTNIDVFVKADNATNATTGLTWTLSDTVGHDAFSLRYYKDGGSQWKNISYSYNYSDAFVSSLGSGSFQTFDLKVIMATSTTDSDPLDFDITFKSVASS